MIRLRKNGEDVDITISINEQCTMEGLHAALDELVPRIEEGLESCEENIDKFDQVVIDKHGNMSTKKVLENKPEPEKEKN